MKIKGIVKTIIKSAFVKNAPTGGRTLENDVLMEAGKIAPVPVHNVRIRQVIGNQNPEFNRMLTGKKIPIVDRTIEDSVEFSKRQKAAFENEPRLPW